MRGLPARLEEFADSLEDTETLVPAHVCEDSDSERPTKVVLNQGKHRIFTHFPNDRNCVVCLRTKTTKALCRRRTGEAVLRAEKFGDLITVDHKVLNEEVTNETIIDRLSWYKIWPRKTKSSQETEKRHNSSSRRRNQVLYTRTTP